MSQLNAIFRSRGSFSLVAALLFPVLLLSGVGAVAATYKVVDLATLTQGLANVVRGPNSAGLAVGAGHVVGSTTGAQGRRGLVFQSGSAPVQVPGLPGSDDSTLYGANDVGTLVGTSNSAVAMRAIATTRAGALRELPPLAGDAASMAFAVNNLNQAAGFSSGPPGERAVVWDASGKPAALPVFPGVSGSRATSINQQGDAAGTVRTASGRLAVLWRRGQVAQQLKLLPNHSSSEARAVNAAGEVVGYSADPAGMRRATLWSAGGAALDLGVLPGGDFSESYGNNDGGDVVGTSTNSVDGGGRAFLWTRAGGLQDLNNLIDPAPYVLTAGVGINSAGMILAIGHDLTPGDGVTAGHSHDDSHELPLRVFLLVR